MQVCCLMPPPPMINLLKIPGANHEVNHDKLEMERFEVVEV